MENKKLDRLILVIGASGSGKTSVAKEMEKEGYNILQSYTTRESRRTEEWGHIHVDNIDGLVEEDLLVFVEVYDGVHYWATNEQYKGLGDTIYIICPQGALEVREKLRDDPTVEVITIYLQSDANIRRERMLYDRDRESLGYRLEVDRDKFKLVEADYVICGDGELSEVVELMNIVLDK